jgi:hypothetical protein
MFLTKRARFSDMQKKSFCSPSLHQGCQIFLETMYQNGEKIIKITTKLPNGRNIFQMGIKYTNIFHSKALQNLHKWKIFGLKTYRLATLHCSRPHKLRRPRSKTQ